MRRRPRRASHGGCNSGTAMELRRCCVGDCDGPAMAVATPALQWSSAGAATTTATDRPWRCNGASPASLGAFAAPLRCIGASPGLRCNIRRRPPVLRCNIRRGLSCAAMQPSPAFAAVGNVAANCCVCSGGRKRRTDELGGGRKRRSVDPSNGLGGIDRTATYPTDFLKKSAG